MYVMSVVHQVFMVLTRATSIYIVSPLSGSHLTSLSLPPPPPRLLPTHTGYTRAATEEMAGCGEAKTSSVSMDEEASMERKFGGIAPKKPLISKDHERAYFDSADWVLGKQSANSSSSAAVESLKPKLKRTPHHQLPPRKPTCASG
ncbi:uncharacterized protein LOC123448841 [Hordeum vulgare subsp. vulgare]|uniref:Negatively light-regulated protein n=2 Tax=Hordeum vulgare subsp. vulgare TaxID=112509 RepID=A0A8I6XQJ0_HORVV|nr:uncharacterized protein LOC123448841 [Hordeum vulgare subsp. vulgare]